MKKIFSLLISVLLLATAAYGQDARGRVPETIVNDVLVAMPAPDASRFAADMKDLAASAPTTVELLCKRVANDGTKIARYQYALSGVVAYVSGASGSNHRARVAEGLRQGIATAKDPTFRHFLLQQLRLIASQEDIATFQAYAEDPEAAGTAISALVDLPGTEAVLMELVNEGKAPKAQLAAAVARKGLKEAEPALLAWGPVAAAEDKPAICHALGRIGSEASASWLMTESPADYAVLLGNLPGDRALKAAQGLLKSDRADLRCAAVPVVVANAPAKAGLKTLADIMKNDVRPVRNAALQAATDAYGTQAVAPVLTKKYASWSDDAKTDVLNWLGTHGIRCDQVVIPAMAADGELGLTAVKVAGQVGGPLCGKALVACLGTNKAVPAMAALKSYREDLSQEVLAALAAPKNDAQRENLMYLASAKHMTAAAPTVIEQASKGSAAAIRALRGVVTESDADVVSTLLVHAEDAQVPALQEALLAALHTQRPDDQTAKVKNLLTSAPDRSRFYPVLARIGSDESVNTLRAFSAKEPAAKSALLTMKNPAILPDLLAAAREGDERSLERYIWMLSDSHNEPDFKRLGLAEAIKLAKSPAIRAVAVDKLGNIPQMKAFLLAGKSLDDRNADVRMAAASAVKRIASKTTEEINYDDLKANLEKASKLFRTRGWADDGYAVDEINKMLLEAKPSPRSVLTEEEKAQGFEMLFDGTDLSKWHGDMEGYTVVNGTISVSANYGATGNLYTNKEYRNFIYRFEFCFMEEGVNNGVGIRTPENVDAAYHGMCELQILDHDAPMYADLRPYQVHGSIYGIVPAKRIKHKPLGEWSTEEIIVEGDHITVKVNGEVITDADVRKVTEGHNVAPDGAKVNPYTIDGHNHPGMFNYKGHISFCGHGAGLKIRNVRILDLGYKK